MTMGWNNYGRGITETCYQCEDRHPACHDHCEKYLSAKEQWKERQERTKRAKEEFFISYQQHVDAIRRTKRKGKG